MRDKISGYLRNCLGIVWTNFNLSGERRILNIKPDTYSVIPKEYARKNMKFLIFFLVAHSEIHGITTVYLSVALEWKCE